MTSGEGHPYTEHRNRAISPSVSSVSALIERTVYQSNSRHKDAIENEYSHVITHLYLRGITDIKKLLLPEWGPFDVCVIIVVVHFQDTFLFAK